jgi:hypothetical protein
MGQHGPTQSIIRAGLRLRHEHNANRPHAAASVARAATGARLQMPLVGHRASLPVFDCACERALHPQPRANVGHLCSSRHGANSRGAVSARARPRRPRHAERRSIDAVPESKLFEPLRRR